MPNFISTLVCINPDLTRSVFLSVYQSRYNSPCNLKYVSILTESPCILKYVSI